MDNESDIAGNLQTAEKLGMQAILLNSRNISYDGTTVHSFEELAEKIL